MNRTSSELLGGRVLGLVGGVAFLLGVAFFVALAIDHGWIGITTRVVIATVVSTALFVAGIWLYERRGRTQAALAAVGAAVAALYLTLTVACTVYHLVSDGLALLAAFAIGSAATVTAVRWNARTVAGLGILGALLAPFLAGGPTTTEGIAFLAVAFGSASAVLVHRRWLWLEVTAFAVSMIELTIWVEGGNEGLGTRLVVLAIFAALVLVAALGHDLRTAADGLESTSALLVLAGGFVLGALRCARPESGGIWLGGLAAGYCLLGVVALRLGRASDEIAFLLLGAALALADVSFGLLANGAVLAIGWAGSAIALATVARKLGERRELVQLGLGAQLALAIGHALLFDASPTVAGSGDGGSAGTAALLAVLVAAAAAARLTRRETTGVRALFDGISVALLAYFERVS